MNLTLMRDLWLIPLPHSLTINQVRTKVKTCLQPAVQHITGPGTESDIAGGGVNGGDLHLLVQHSVQDELAEQPLAVVARVVLAAVKHARAVMLELEHFGIF